MSKLDVGAVAGPSVTGRAGRRVVRSLVVTSDRLAPHVLSLAGTLDGRGAAELEAVAEPALAGSPMGLVLDVTGLAAIDADGIAGINRLGALARLHAATVTVQTPEGPVHGQLAASVLHEGVRIELTQHVPSRAGRGEDRRAAAPRPRPSDGVARRTAPGFIASFGEGRICTTAGCATRLSQYNATDHCAVHEVARSRGQLH